MSEVAPCQPPEHSTGVAPQSNGQVVDQEGVDDACVTPSPGQTRGKEGGAGDDAPLAPLGEEQELPSSRLHPVGPSKRGRKPISTFRRTPLGVVHY